MTAKTLPREYEQLTHMANCGKLMLRAVLGVLILLHGIAKVKVGLGPVVGMLTQHGLPSAFAYLVYVGEVLAPLMVIVGLWTRAAALVIAVNMVVAVGLAHMPQLLKLGEQGGYALELQAMYLFGALAVMLLGAGRYSAGGAMGRWN